MDENEIALLTVRGLIASGKTEDRARVEQAAEAIREIVRNTPNDWGKVACGLVTLELACDEFPAKAKS